MHLETARWEKRCLGFAPVSLRAAPPSPVAGAQRTNRLLGISGVINDRLCQNMCCLANI